MTSGELASLYGSLADGAEAEEPTTYTDERLLAATKRLRDVLAVKARAAEQIRGSRRSRRRGRRIRL